MVRRILAIILLIVALCIAIIAPVLAYTPVGTQLLSRLSRPTPTATPSPTPIPPTPTPPPPPTPILTPRGNPPKLSATAAILLDTDTGRILADINGETPMPMASTTKIMTALIAIQTADLDTMVTIHQDAVNEAALHMGSTANLVVGDKIALKYLLYGLMLPSGDDAAQAIADALGGGSSANFVNTMNLFAQRLHLFQTHYINADGLTYYAANGQPVPEHYTTAYDLVRLTQYAMSIPLFAQIVDTQQYILPPGATRHGYTWPNTNDLLKTYTGMTGVKTGHTVEAGYCLVFAATRNEHHLIGVVLHSPTSDTRFTDAKALLDWGFALPLLPPA